MTTLTIFKSSCVNRLRLDLKANLQKYKKGDPWADDYARRTNGNLTTSFEMKTPLALLDPDKGDLKDLENAIRMHKSLSHLTPLQARDPRLWVRLAHIEYWEYMRKRWDIERHLSDPDKALRFIDSRYFVTQSQSRALLRHGIARLWWTSRLSYDPDRENHYELTQVLLSTLDITQQILERGMGRAPEVVRGFLEFLLRNKDPLLMGGDKNRSRIRLLAKFLNMQGGVCILDCLSRAGIIALLESELSRILNGSAEKVAETTAR